VLALITLPAGSIAPRPRAQTSPAKSVRPAVAQVNTRSRAAGRPEAMLVSAALAVQLQAGGHELLEAGRYAAAIDTLKRAVTATGEQLDECLEPVSAMCLTYAYALYDLGHALQLSGHPSAAVGVLQRRLRIDNQRPTVQNELTLARTQAGLEAQPDSALRGEPWRSSAST
jgi:tetratricopeptide (TPR) repeat protein